MGVCINNIQLGDRGKIWNESCGILTEAKAEQEEESLGHGQEAPVANNKMMDLVTILEREGAGVILNQSQS